MKKIIWIMLIILAFAGSVSYWYGGLRMMLFRPRCITSFESNLYVWGMTVTAIALGLLIIIFNKPKKEHLFERASGPFFFGCGLMMLIGLVV